MRLKLASALVVVALLVGILGMSGTISAGTAPDGPESGPPVSVEGRSPGASAPVLAAPGSRIVRQTDGESPTDDPDAFPAVAAERRIEQNPVLIIEDTLPWGYDSIQQVLSGASIGYDVVTSAEIPTINLNPYEMVIVPSVQSDGYYSSFNANLTKFENYVIGGGKLWMSGCTYSTATVLPQFPGGVVNNDTNPNDNENQIVEPSHPWVQGVPNPMSGTAASHNHLTGLPPSAPVIAQGSIGATLIEYPLGAGHVAATGQTLEWAFANSQDGAPILEQSLLYMYFYDPTILHLTTIDAPSTSPSARRALNELGYIYLTQYAWDWTGIDFDPYDRVLITMDGGSVAEPSVQKIRTDVIDRGKRAFFIGGTAIQTFAQAVNDFLVPNNAANYMWVISSQPHWTLTNPGHELAEYLPGSYNFVNSSAAFYMLRVTDPLVEVIGENGDGYPAFFYKRAAFPLTGAGVQQIGSLVWYTSSPYGSYWTNQSDFDVLEQIILNGLTYSTRYSYVPAISLNYPPQAWDQYYEPNNSKEDAYGPLVSGQNYLAYPNDADDYYHFTLASAQSVDFLVSNFAPTSDHGDLLIYDDMGTLKKSFGVPGMSEMAINNLALGAGKYYVRVYVSNPAFYSSSQLYTLRVTWP